MTDSWSERPMASEPADSQPQSRRVPQASAPDYPGYDPTRAAPGAPATPMRPAARGQAQTPGHPQARMPTSSKPTKGKAAGANPFVWDGGRITEQEEPGAPSAPPAAAPVARPPAGPPESRRSSLRRTQWTGAPAEEAAAGGDGGSPTGPPDGPEGGSGGRGRQVGLVFLGALVLVGLLIWVIASTLPNNGPRTTAAVDSAASASPSRSLQPLGASAIPVVSDTARATPSTAKSTHSAAPHTTAVRQPAAVKTTPSAAHTTAAAAPTLPTVNVAITDSADGLVIDVDNSGTTAGTLVGTWSSDKTAAQRWHLVLQPNGSYVVYSELMDLKEGLEINTNANDYSGDTVTTLQSYADDAAMQWTVKYLGSSKYELVNGYNGQCLTGGGKGVADATITCNTSDAHQAWTITG